MLHDVLRIGPRITAVPIIHGSGDCALEVRRVMLEHRFDCVAVPLPPSFQRDVERAIARLPVCGMVVQPETSRFSPAWAPGEEGDQERSAGGRRFSCVPIDPCQPVIAALRAALGERLPRQFIDLETARFASYSAVLPDPYALKKVPLARFAAALLPHLERLPPGQPQDRAAHMAQRLRDLEQRFRSVLFVCSVLDWPWIREAYVERRSPESADEDVEATEEYAVDPRQLLFLLGELPFVTALYERARAALEEDSNLAIDGVKELLLVARDSYRQEFRGRARQITPHLLRLCLKYIRNLSLIERRMTPDLYSIVIAARQFFGDQVAIHVAERARDYPYVGEGELEVVQLGIGRGRLPDGELVELVSRLPGPPVVWRNCQLLHRPHPKDLDRWRMQWNPYTQCSWPPEDERIEDFRTHVFDRAQGILGADLARTEKFTTSVMDGIDIRETLRHWYDGEIYVRVLPPARGHIDTAVMLFDSPADPRDYPWRTTWYAEHEQESTLAFFATDFRRELVGPGICLANYGGALFLFPPRWIPDIWTDRRLDFTETLEERLLAAACLHSSSPHVALLSPLPPGAGWRRLARRFARRWVHVPLAQFSEATLQQLRMAHVLNGKQVRSYAAHFIRRP